jgi:hypothetical protein
MALHLVAVNSLLHCIVNLIAFGAFSTSKGPAGRTHSGVHCSTHVKHSKVAQ